MSQPSGDAVLPYASSQIPYYVPSRRLATVVTALIGISLAIGIVSIGSTMMQIGLLEDAKAGQSITATQADDNDRRVLIVSLVDLASLVVAGIAFLMWIHRSTKNLYAFNPIRMRFTPGWAVGYFFIPIMNLWRPYQIVSEIWKQSARDPQSEPQPSMVSIWWGTWLAGGFVTRWSNRMTRGEPTIEQLITSSWALVAADVLSTIAGIICIIIVQRITRMQDEKVESLSGMNLPLAPEMRTEAIDVARPPALPEQSPAEPV